MADNPYSFRTALQGFNRSDVVSFIDASTAKHESELRQLQADNERLQQQLEEANAYIGQLQETIAAMQQMPAPEAPAIAPEPLPVLEEPEPSIAPTPPSNFEELELAAYRRAEQVERSAHERAAKLIQQINQLVGQTDQQLVEDDHMLSRLASELAANISALQQAVLSIRGTLDTSSSAMRNLQLLPQEEE